MSDFEYDVILALTSLCAPLLQVWSVKYSGNGMKLVSVSDDKAVHIYDTPL